MQSQTLPTARDDGPTPWVLALGDLTERVGLWGAIMEIRDGEGLRVPVTASLGVAHRRDRVRGAGAALLEQALGLADKALYAAKRNGKNRSEFVSFADLPHCPA